ncbi:MAG: HEAT repeat domain-containing protein [Planctomycetes bacterium]|nr:HEAT repeat domain-containing protein [Planctomycetota bacterium]HQF65761.1 HEAT repeat domain-containing protein [Planctomycetota bacterium]
MSVDPAALDKAVASLRNADLAKLSKEQLEAKAEEIDQAWKLIVAAGPVGLARLKQELKALDQAKQPDPFFRLGAGVLLWQLAKLDAADLIAEQWRQAPLTLNYNYVFYTAFDAAKTQDARAVPLLKACLADNEGSIFVAMHFMRVQWPLTHQFLWGAYGSKGLPVLAEILETSKNLVELKSALVLLTMSHAAEALPTIRQLTKHEDGDLRRHAVRALGEFGHPDDYAALMAGLKSTDPEDLHAYVFALYEYGDLRCVADVAPLLKSPHDEVRREVLATLKHLVCPASLEALECWSREALTDEEKTECREYVVKRLEDAKLTWDAYQAKSPDERRAIAARLRATNEERFVLKKDDRRMTHDELLAAAKEWKERHRLDGGTFEWAEDRHVLSAATPADLDLLRDIEAALYWRLSDECLYEVRTIHGLIRRLGRSRYRAEVDQTEKVAPPAATKKL